MDALALVNLVTRNPEEYGEAWMVCSRAMGYFDPERGELPRLLRVAWARHKIDRRRKEAKRRRVWLQRNDEIDVEQPARETRELPRLPLPGPAAVGTIALYCRGVKLKDIAKSTGIPAGTVKSQIAQWLKKAREAA